MRRRSFAVILVLSAMAVAGAGAQRPSTPGEKPAPGERPSEKPRGRPPATAPRMERCSLVRCRAGNEPGAPIPKTARLVEIAIEADSLLQQPAWNAMTASL